MNISVIIPVYNVEKYVERCILSIMSQTYTESVECIVVNDCTPDNSMKIVEKMVSDYKGQIQFKLLYHEHNILLHQKYPGSSDNSILPQDVPDKLQGFFPGHLHKFYLQTVLSSVIPSGFISYSLRTSNPSPSIAPASTTNPV